MLESRIKPTSDIKAIGLKMSRTKYQRGSIKKLGNGRYLARWRRYVVHTRR